MESRPVFNSADSNLFFSRNDPADPRLGDVAKALSPYHEASELFDTMKEIVSNSASTSGKSARDFVLAGYPDDDGIRLNGGRLGAASGPNEIRRALYKMTAPLRPHPNRPESMLWDLGNLEIESPSQGRSSSDEVGRRHQQVSAAASAVLSAGASWIGLGGGHDYGFADGAAFCEWAKHARTTPLVINFDAHLDVRPVDKGISSGTPFRRLLDAYPETDFVEIGIQGHCNSRQHLEWVLARKNSRVLTQEELCASGEPMITAVTRLMGDWLLRPRPVFLSIDIDGFSSAVAPGCSQSWATGFMPSDFFPVLDFLNHRLDVRALGIYEVSPPLDADNRTSKLAAQIIHRVIS